MSKFAAALKAAKEARAVAFQEHAAFGEKVVARTWDEPTDAPMLAAAETKLEAAQKEVERIEGFMATEQRSAAWAGIGANVIPSGRLGDKRANVRREFRLIEAIRAKLEEKPLTGLSAEMFTEADNEARSAGIHHQLDPRAAVRIPGWMNPDFDGEEVEKRDWVYGTAASAGNLVATDKGKFIEVLKPELFSMKVGAQMFSGLVGDVDFPRLTSRFTTAIAATENAAAAEVTPTTDLVQLRAKRITSFVELSRKLLVQSSIGVENLVRRQFNNEVRQTLDTQIISGTGAGGQILGLLNRAINDIVLGANGLALTWANVVDFETQVASADALYENLAYLMNAKTFGKLKTTEKASTSGQFVAMGAIGKNSEVNDYQALISNILPSNLTKGASGAVLSAAIFGNWNDLYLGQWGGLEMIINPYSRDTEDLTRITVHSFWDAAVAHELSFTKCDEIVTT